MTTELTTFEFYGDRLDIAREGETIWVSTRRICEGLGLDPAAQMEKLRARATSWAVIGQRPMTGPDGKIYETFCIERRSIPMWLATVNADRVADSVRPKLVRYQREVADVLADHFLGRRGGRADEALLARMTTMEVQLQALLSRASESAKPSIGPGAARAYVLDPLKEIARQTARALSRTNQKAFLSLRASAERSLRRELNFPADRNMRWDMFPRERLGEAVCAIARMQGDARELARVAAGPVKQTRLALVPA